MDPIAFGNPDCKTLDPHAPMPRPQLCLHVPPRMPVPPCCTQCATRAHACLGVKQVKKQKRAWEEDEDETAAERAERLAEAARKLDQQEKVSSNVSRIIRRWRMVWSSRLAPMPHCKPPCFTNHAAHSTAHLGKAHDCAQSTVLEHSAR